MVAEKAFPMFGAAMLAGVLLVAQGPQVNAQGKGKNVGKAATRDAGQSPASQPRLKTLTPKHTQPSRFKPGNSGSEHSAGSVMGATRPEAR